jgi:glycosyltransferase involved in cell wall biosynthesis
MTDFVYDFLDRKPRILWANTYCLLDSSSGASISVRSILNALASHGWDVGILGATHFDAQNGSKKVAEYLKDKKPASLVKLKDSGLLHHLVITKSISRSEMSTAESDAWFAVFQHLLKTFKPDVIFYYGGRSLEQHAVLEAHVRGVPTVAYLVNENYQGSSWCRDVDMIITDSKATSDMYKEKVGFIPVPVGKLIDPRSVVPAKHLRKRVLFINPSYSKGVSLVVALAFMMQKRRPDIKFEVVESRGDWHRAVKEVTTALGTPMDSLPNVHLTPTTNDMRPVYARARVLMAPSLWWESGARVLAEAMLNGIPAITTGRGGSPEMIGEGGIVLNLPQRFYEKPYNKLPGTNMLEKLVDVLIRLFDDEAYYKSLSAKATAIGKRLHQPAVTVKRIEDALKPLIEWKSGNIDQDVALRELHKHNI